jgi:hypothetical protein
MALINYLPIFSERSLSTRRGFAAFSLNGQPQERSELIDIVAMFYPFRAQLAAERRTRCRCGIRTSCPAPVSGDASAPFAPLNILLPAAAQDRGLRISSSACFWPRPLWPSSFSPLADRRRMIVSGILFALCGFTIQWQGMQRR